MDGVCDCVTMTFIKRTPASWSIVDDSEECDLTMSGLSFNQRLMRLTAAIESLHSDCPSEDAYQTSLSTLLTIIANLVTHPTEPKYRSLNTQSAGLRSKLTKYSSGVTILRLLGFAAKGIEDENKLELLPANEDREFLQTATSTIQRECKHRKNNNVSEATSDAVTDNDNTMADDDSKSAQERADHEMSAKLQAEYDQRPFHSLAPSTIRDRDADTDTNADTVIDDRELRPNLDPTYNISDVRRSLLQLKSEVENDNARVYGTNTGTSTDASMDLAKRDAYQFSLSILSKITHNLLKSKDAKFRTLNLRNETLLRNVNIYDGAIEYLNFLGFVRVTNSPTSDTMVLAAEDEDETKILRALQIVSRISGEFAVSDSEREQLSLPPIDREPHLMVFNQSLLHSNLQAAPTAHTTSTNASTGTDTEMADGSERADQALLLQVASTDRRLNELYQRTDIFFNRAKQAEIKARYRRKYSKTLIRIIFPASNSILTVYFRPWEKMSLLFELLVEKYLVSDSVEQLLNCIVLRIPPQSKFTYANDGTKTFQSLGLVPAATFYYSLTIDTGSECLRPEALEHREPMQFIPVPVADNAAEIADRKKQDRINGFLAPASQSSQPSSPRSQSVDDDDINDVEVERRLAAMSKRGKPAAAARPTPSAWLRK